MIIITIIVIIIIIAIVIVITITIVNVAIVIINSWLWIIIPVFDCSCSLFQWKLPWRSCAVIAYLFVFYCVVLIVFIAMVFRIASRRCLSPICVVLYFACGLALCYSTYCCGCIERMRHFWKTWIESNRQLLILTMKDIGQSAGAALRSQNSFESQKAEYVWSWLAANA